MVRLRKATKTDRKTALEIIFLNLEKSLHPFYSPRFSRRMKGAYTRRISNHIQDGTLFIIEKGDKAIGTIGLCANEVKAFFIHPLYQGMGYGRRALFEIEKIAKAIGHDVLHLDAFLNAVGFYLKLGFVKRRKIKKKAEHDPTVAYEVRRMKKKL